jgi:hypothetical protein
VVVGVAKAVVAAMAKGVVKGVAEAAEAASGGRP